MFIIIIILFILASLIAVYSFGHFARQAKGEASYALKIQKDQTKLDRILGAQSALHPNQSSLLLIPSNLDAFAIRAISARDAGRSLDLQYYIWHDDLTGQLLGLELLDAADRGVRVRIILDDMNAYSRSSLLATLGLHPNISIRMFNPTRARNNSLIRGIEMILRIFSINRRMHNKSWIADGRMAIVGGRNIGNEYFGAADNRNFFDADLLIGGEAVKETETIFDDFWNSDAVIPIEALVTAKANSLNELRQKIQLKRQNIAALPYLKKLQDAPNVKSLFKGELNEQGWQVHWTNQVHVYSDPATKAFGNDQDKWLFHHIKPVLENASAKISLISPYFVPGKAGVNKFSMLHRQGIDIDILTNSLAANDVIMAHSGYAPYRKELLQNDIKLYELKPFGKTERSLIGSSDASLHTKAFLVDNTIGFVGSFNFDPRSANLNTEMGIIFKEPSIVKALQNEFNMKISHDFSYQVVLIDDKLRWLDENEQNEPITWSNDPQSKWWQRTIATLASYLPIESQL
ncbi:phospholipase D family protein [Orbus wheelerorum]|uniref:phospholipase D family protein n=1 Tax=Orbus wheelerorum TaxID=3074111 RepID=UPI00370D321E